MPTIPDLQMNDGVRIPQIGLGIRLIDPIDVPEALSKAVALGYRLVDTAQSYRNEQGVGSAISSGLLDRSRLFVTSKIASANQGRSRTLSSFDESLTRLGLEVLDLCLIHWPQPMYDQYVDTWGTLIELRDAGRVRTIGVSNFTRRHLERLMDETGVVPAVNQIELHPQHPQSDLRDFHRRHGILSEAWAPLGQGGDLLSHPIVRELAAKKHRTPAQVVIRWHVELGNVVVPKTSHAHRMLENIDVEDFTLDPKEMDLISSMPATRLGPDPETMSDR
ncbi:MAG: 2,5-didehydrogluconate reductase [Acidimicrobiaceae bacterium]|jgi:2,5-diketo-D-gluconate reductase A|nr:2,5-didehydrogluconate reductase [Acidimicrobiaceae bacterium]